MAERTIEIERDRSSESELESLKHPVVPVVLSEKITVIEKDVENLEEGLKELRQEIQLRSLMSVLPPRPRLTSYSVRRSENYKC